MHTGPFRQTVERSQRAVLPVGQHNGVLRPIRHTALLLQILSTPLMSMKTFRGGFLELQNTPSGRPGRWKSNLARNVAIWRPDELDVRLGVCGRK